MPIMGNSQTQSVAIIIVIIFLILAGWHSIIVPITQGEDELAHYRYLSFIAQTGRLPANAAERKEAWYRADWPPLYHLLVGWIVSPIDTTQPLLKDVGESPRRRLVGEILYPRLIIYTEDASWPWQDGILAWHIGRFLSILFAAGALGFTYLTTLELFRKTDRLPELPLSPQLLAIASTALLAFTPRFLFTSAMLSDDSLLILLSAVFIWLLLRALRGDDRWRVYGGMGLVLGLSMTTKYSTGLFPLLIVPVVLWRSYQAGWRWWQWFGRLIVSGLAAVIGAGWWFGWIGYYFNTIEEDGLVSGLLRALLNTGPDVSMRRIFAFFARSQFTGQERPDAIEPGTFSEWFVYLFQTFWGVPVLEQDPLFPWAYLVILLFCLLALAGIWQLWRAANSQLRITLAVLLLIAVFLFPFPLLRFFLTRNIPETGQGRHILFPAAQAIPILLVLGIAAVSRRWVMAKIAGVPLTAPEGRRTTFYVLLLPLILLVWSLFQLVYMTGTYPAPLPVRTTTFKASSIPHPLEHTFADAIEVLGYDIQPDPVQVGVYRLTLFWKSRRAVGQNYRAQVQLVDPQGEARFTWVSHPLNGRYPTRAWDRGDVIRDVMPLPLAALPPNDYEIRVNLLLEAEDTPLLGQPVPVAQLNLPTSPPLVRASSLAGYAYRLWVDQAPARPRQAIALSWTEADPEQPGNQTLRNRNSEIQDPGWALLGPDNVPRFASAQGDRSNIFLVGLDWPSGEYRLQLRRDGTASLETEPVLTIANEARLFELPPVPKAYVPLVANFANQVKLLGYTLPTRRVEAGGGLPLTLYWQSLAPVLDDYIVFDVLLDENQQPYGGYDRLPREYYSTILWAEGEIVEDGFAVPVVPGAPHGVYHLHVGLYSLKTGAPVSLSLVQDGQISDATSVVIGPIKVGGPPPEVTTTNANPQIVLNQSFNSQITLLGYDMTDQDNQPIFDPPAPLNTNLSSSISNLKLTLYWRADSAIDVDYTTFLHLRDQRNRIVAQKDNPPAGGRYPTSLWEVGEVIVDEITVPLNGQLPLGQYTPVIGLYDFATGDRVPAAGLPENELRLESISLP